MHENLAQAIKEGRQDITLDAILKSQQMKTPADLSEDEMRSGQCEICQENLWPSDTVAASAPDMIVRIACDKGMCLSQDVHHSSTRRQPPVPQVLLLGVVRDP